MTIKRKQWGPGTTPASVSQRDERWECMHGISPAPKCHFCNGKYDAEEQEMLRRRLEGNGWFPHGEAAKPRLDNLPKAQGRHVDSRAYDRHFAPPLDIRSKRPGWPVRTPRRKKKG
jgi:hypothetical protein